MVVQAELSSATDAAWTLFRALPGGSTGLPGANATETIMSKIITATAKTAAKSEASSRKLRASVNPRAKKGTRTVKPHGKAQAVTDAPAKSKCGQILQLLRRNKGASLSELRDATGWQAHSVRGFLSGTVKKRMGLALSSVKPEHGNRRYTIREA